MRIGSAPEVAEIGIERLGAGHGQEHRAEREQPGRAVVEQEAEAVDRIDGSEDAEIIQDVHQAAHGHDERTRRR